jgi:RNA polymerase sigma-70 factor (ECF subfamily)
MEEKEIIRRCQENDLSAYKMIYDRYEQPLLHTALRILGQQQDAEDAVQTTFLKLYRGIHNYRLDSKFSTYLFRILINHCYDLLRKKRKARIQPIEEAHLAQDSMHDVRHYLEKAISTLPEKMKACFVLFAVEQFKLREIAQIMEISLGAVKSNIFHAKTHLRSRLSDHQIKE